MNNLIHLWEMNRTSVLHALSLLSLYGSLHSSHLRWLISFDENVIALVRINADRF